MFRSARRFPFYGLILFGLGFFVASALAGSGAGSVVGFGLSLLFLPILLFKLFLLFFLFSAAMRFFAGRHRGGKGGERHGWHHHGAWREQAQWRYRGGPYPPAPSTSSEEREWDEHMRQARREVDDLDTPYADTDGKADTPTGGNQ